MIHQRECPIETLIHVLGGKWKPMILWHLIESKKRFNDLEKLIPDASQKCFHNISEIWNEKA